jgi:hypothetical protein
MSYGEYKFGDFMKNYDVGGPSDGLVGFAEGFAAGFVPAYAAANKAGADKELALAKLDKQAEIDAAKAKADATSDYNEMMKKAKNIISTLALPPGVNPNDAVMTAFTMLNGGISDNTVLNQLSKAIEDGTLEYSDEPPTETAPPAAVETVPNDAPASPLEQEMDEAFGDQSAVQPAPEEAPTVVSQDDTPAETDGEPVQEASLGSEWAQRFVERQESRINAASERQVAALDTQTDVTNPEGLGGGSDSAANVVLAEADGEATPSERTAATVRTLKINPLAKTAAAEEIEVNKIDDYEKAMAAVVALTGVAGQEDKLKRAKILLKQFTNTPKIGDMNEQQLDAFIRQTNSVNSMPPEYKRIDTQVMNALRAQAADFLKDTRNEALPSLSTTDPEELRGVQRDITAGRITNVSGVYKDQLAQRIAALDLKIEAERKAGLTPEQAVQEALNLFIKGLPEDQTFEEKEAAINHWMSTEGQLLLRVMRFTDKPDKPQEINNLEELATQNLIKSAAYEAASTEARRQMVLDLKSALSGQKKDTLTSSEYAAEYASKTLDLSSDDPAVVAAAQSWFDNIAPALQAGMQAAATASAKPGEQKTVTVTYTTTDGQTRRASGVPTGTGYTLADGTEVPKESVQNIVSDDDRDYTTKLRNSISVPRTKQRDGMNAMVDLSQQAYALEELAINDPVVLTLVGAGTSAVASAKREANTLFTMLQISAEEAYDQGMSSQSVVEKVMSDFLKTNKVSDEVAANYKQFAAKLTRFIFAAGKTLGQEGNGFSNQDYTNILASLKAGNGVESFVKNMRSFVRERSVFTDAGANGLKKMSEVQELRDYGIDLGIETMTYEEYSKSDFAPEDFAAWLNSPIDSLKQNAEPPATSTAPLRRGDDGIFRLTPEGGTN